MLSKAFKDSFLNTYFKEEDSVFVTELYDKWRRKPPKLYRITYSKDEAEMAHNEVAAELLAIEKKKPSRKSFS